ncbi:MFS transporter [Sphaerisporangium fuscum]|uniref:MFS transporter n=1 Tax=Sphaerisporangium fuscum TaxID=2835868 RepID=UPI001BDC9950|nr:MFS transporter [Sphaerisporangium fuscum]
MSPRTSTPALLTLALGYFTLGTVSLSVVGLITPIGTDLRVAPGQVGLLVTVFALTFAVVAPLAPAALNRMSRKRTLIVGLVLLTAGAALCATASGYAVLVAGRVIAALGAAVFGPAASAAGSLIVPPERRQQALATVFGGMTAATVLGVPLSTLLGDAFGWRPALLGGAVLAGLALVLVLLLVPALPAAEHPSLAAYREVLATPGAFATVGTTLLMMAAQFVVYGLAGAYLAQRFDASAALVSAALLANGIAGIVGNTAAPRIAQRLGPARTVATGLAGLAVAWAALLVAPATTVVILVLLALWGFANTLYHAPQQGRLVTLLPEHRALILALNASALYLGMSLGSLLGSTLLPAVGATWLPAFSLAVLAVAGVTHAVSARRATTPLPTR